MPQTQNIFQAPSCHLQRKPDIFWPTGKVQKHFSFGKQQYRNPSEGTGHRGSCCYGVTLTRSRCARCAPCQAWYPLSTQGCLWKAEQPPGSQFGTAQKGTEQHKPSPSGSTLAAWWEVHFNEFFHEGIQEVALNCTCSETKDSHKLTLVVIWPSNYIQINTSKKQL